MDHDEHPTTGCVRETLEELGIDIVLDDTPPTITQQIFNMKESHLSRSPINQPGMEQLKI